MFHEVMSRDRRTPGFRLGKLGGARGRGVYEAKRIRSHYLTFADREASRVLSVPSVQRRASLDAINAATMRLCQIDPPA
jgi:hypothetical protein